MAESTQRLNDYIVFITPRSMEGVWDLLETLKYVKSYPNAEKIIFVVCTTIALYLRKYHSNSIPKNYEKIFSFVFGKNW